MPTFFFTDIENSASLWERHPAAMGQALARHDAILRQQIEHHGGRIFKHTGDGFLAIFESGKPLHCALGIQRCLAREQWGTLGELRVRIALHAGPAEQRGEDFFGPALNHTARVLSLGWGGQILLTPEVVARYPLPSGASLQHLGRHLFDHLPEAQEVYGLRHPDLPWPELPLPGNAAPTSFTRSGSRDIIGASANWQFLTPQSGGRSKGHAVARTILVVDDKASVRTLVREYLTEAGFNVLTARDGREALMRARQERPDLILLDIMMPEMDGYEFIRAYRRDYQTPIILLTARLEETDKVLGLELGADDYVTKPFGMRELVARIRAVLRRVGQELPPAEVLRVADIVLDRGSRAVEVAGRPVQLTPSEFDLLAALMAVPGRVFSRQDLLMELRGAAFESVERTIDVHIRNLRAKIEPNPAQPCYVETVFGVGYRFRCE
jgi:DNA-binding response OmpR family regulator/class 3 adenylate cyclase